ncbi:hypothetical protein [Streptomyces sp. NPDC054962]
MIGLILVSLLVTGVVWAGRRMHRYPGGREYAFGPRHEADRRRLDSCRDAVRSLRSATLRGLKEAQDRVTEADQAYEQRIGELEQAWQHLQENLGRGEYRNTTLGAMSLYEHMVVFKGQDVPLKGLSVEVKRGESHYYLYLTVPKGYQDFETFAHAEYAEHEVFSFESAIRNAVIGEEEACAERAASIRTVEAQLAAARADTGPKLSARQHLEAVRAQQDNDEKLSRALTELDAALDRWQELTGHRPLI